MLCLRASSAAAVATVRRALYSSAGCVAHRSRRSSPPLPQNLLPTPLLATPDPTWLRTQRALALTVHCHRLLVKALCWCVACFVDSACVFAVIDVEKSRTAELCWPQQQWKLHNRAISSSVVRGKQTRTSGVGDR